jgi:molybdopterin converting factor small subunit
MKIEVELFGFLADYSPEGKGKFQIDFGGAATVDRLMERLTLPSDITLMVLINGQRVDTGHQLNDGDEVFIFSPVAGG